MSRLFRSLTSVGAALPATRAASRALAQVASGPDRAPAWQHRWQRWATAALAALGGAMIVLAILGLVLAVARHGPPPPGPAWLWIGPGWEKPAAATLALTAATAGLDVAGAWRRTRRALAAQAERAEREQARRAVLEERARIAREMHDVVAHHLSLMAIQAGSAPYRLAGLPEQACEEFTSLSQAARAALTDMRRLLGVLRSDQPAERTPQELSMPAACGPVPQGAEVCAYRIVQEALSNAGRHAPGAAVTVNVGKDDGHLSLQVANGPGIAGQPPANVGQPGHGLAGMRERVALLGGSLSAGPAPGGGFAVTALLPLREPPS